MREPVPTGVCTVGHVVALANISAIDSNHHHVNRTDLLFREAADGIRHNGVTGEERRYPP